jgi:chitinase
MLLTIASSAGSQNYNKLKLAEMASYLDFFNLLIYDYVGFFGNVTEHQANLYPSADILLFTFFFTDAAIKDYIKVSVLVNKITLGMPLYDRVFQQMNGMRKHFHGVSKGSLKRASEIIKFYLRQAL